MKYLYIDFEFRSGTGRYFELLICATTMYEGVMQEWNLLKKEGREALASFLDHDLWVDTVIVAYGVDTEYRAINTLFNAVYGEEFGCDRFTSYICLYREFLCISNKSKTMNWGYSVGKEGEKVFKRFNPRASGADSRTGINLPNAIFKLLQVYDPQHAKAKNYYHKLCISAGVATLHKEYKNIQEYCNDDVKYLPLLLEKMIELYKPFYVTERHTLNIMLNRGSYGKLIGKKTQRGYYINRQGTVNLISNKDSALASLIDEIQRKFPHQPRMFSRKKEGGWKKEVKKIRNWIDKNISPDVKKLLVKTDGGEWSLAEESLGKIYRDRYNLPENDFLAQIYKYIYMEQQLKGLELYRGPIKGKANKKFGHYLDLIDGTVRPRFNDFGSQTGRNQPSANGYLLLKPAWMRTLLVPPPGHVMMLSDYAKEEPLIQAILCGDENLWRDYQTEDIYVAFGLRARILQENMRNTPQWKTLRAGCKKTILSIMYGITEFGLSRDLSIVMKQTVTPTQALYFINAFYAAYPKVIPWQQKYYRNYRMRKFAMLNDGWIMHDGNFNERSVKNFPTQGHGGVVMRNTDQKLESAGLWSPLSLHDAHIIYSPKVDGKINWEDAKTLLNCMHEGFVEGMKHSAANVIKMDLEVVTGEGELPTNCTTAVRYKYGEVFPKITKKYIDERATEDLKLLDKYFKPFWELPQEQ